MSARESEMPREPQSTMAVVLAAGKGTRMRSDKPKVLHTLDGRPLLFHVLDTARAAGVGDVVVVVGYRADEVRGALEQAGRSGVRYALQSEQRGTGHAVSCALPELEGHDGPVMILSGDVPRISQTTLRALVEACASSSAGLAMLTFRPQDPTGYGRIVRDAEGRPAQIVEHKDATPQQRAIDESNAGVYCMDAGVLRRHLGSLTDDNAAGELYLTDLVHLAARDGEVVALEVPAWEVAGVNTVEQLAQMEADLAARGG